MITLIKNVKLYTPEKQGIKDILVIGSKFASIEEQLMENFPEQNLFRIVDGSGKIAIPGFIDSHVHILGGGGEGGYHTRTPEIRFSDLTTSGVTTVVGCLGTDGLTRDMMSLLAKARGLENEGLTSYIYTGSYQVPVRTLTNSVMQDLLAIDKIIGVGEVALSDHRSSQPTYEEFVRMVADARVGGMLSGKAGVVNIHLGDGSRKIDFLMRAVAESEIPITQYLPTHVNRNSALLDDCIAFAKMGGTIDFTGSENPEMWEELDGEVRVSQAMKRLLDAGVSQDNFTLSSDAQGSLPIFNSKKEFVGLGVGSAKCLLTEIKDCVQTGIPLEIALRALTVNPARILKLPHKGQVATGFDADLCLLDESELDILDVMARGQWVVRDGLPVVHGTFEQNQN